MCLAWANSSKLNGKVFVSVEYLVIRKCARLHCDTELAPAFFCDIESDIDK